MKEHPFKSWIFELKVNPIQILGALMANKQQPNLRKGFIYVQAYVNGHEVAAMIDTGTTHNFVTEREIEKLGLNLSKHASKIKVVNSEAKPVKGVADAELCVGPWKGDCSFTVVMLDDFDVILGQDFMMIANVAVMPVLGGVLIIDQVAPCFVKGRCMEKSKS